MSEQQMRLTILGCRGSVPTEGPEYSEFGGSTSCYLVQAHGQNVILDAGSGIAHAHVPAGEPTAILLSHVHLDHIVGLGMFDGLLQKDAVLELYVPAASDEHALQLLDNVYSPPYWPLRLCEYAADLRVHTMPPTLKLGTMFVRTMKGNHPGGCMVYKIACEDQSIVYATDYEHEPESYARLVEFCRGASLVLYDGQYADTNYDAHKGFGHSIYSKAAELKSLSGANQVLIIHHDPQATDDFLNERELSIRVPGIRYAREGEVLYL